MDALSKMITLSSSGALDRIGAGFCGSVWAPRTPEHALLPVCIKREDGGPGRSMQNEQALQTLVNEQIAASDETEFLVPRCYQYLSKTDNDTWGNLLGSLPSGYEPCNAMISDRIQPISASSRQQMIDRYCPAGLQAQISADNKNHHCLLRLYLGRRRLQSSHTGRPRFFGLRNLPIHSNQAEELDLPVVDYARVMARGLAFMNWKVGIDGNDVEFVLAPPRTQPLGSQRTWSSPLIGENSMWLLDFDCCREIVLEECIDQIARSFWRNDPYFPRPNSESIADQALWGEFTEEYRRASLDMIPTGPFADKLGESSASLIDEVLARIEGSRDVYIRG